MFRVQVFRVQVFGVQVFRAQSAPARKKKKRKKKEEKKEKEKKRKKKKEKRKKEKRKKKEKKRSSTKNRCQNRPFFGGGSGIRSKGPGLPSASLLNLAHVLHLPNTFEKNLWWQTWRYTTLLMQDFSSFEFHQAVG